MGLFSVVLLLGQRTVSKFLSLDLIGCATIITVACTHSSGSQPIETSSVSKTNVDPPASLRTCAFQPNVITLDKQVLPLPPSDFTWYFGWRSMVSIP